VTCDAAHPRRRVRPVREWRASATRRAISSVGRAAPLQGVGRRFESVIAHVASASWVAEATARSHMTTPYPGTTSLARTPHRSAPAVRSKMRAHCADPGWRESYSRLWRRWLLENPRRLASPERRVHGRVPLRESRRCAVVSRFGFSATPSQCQYASTDAKTPIVRRRGRHPCEVRELAAEFGCAFRIHIDMRDPVFFWIDDHFKTLHPDCRLLIRMDFEKII